MGLFPTGNKLKSIVYQIAGKENSDIVTIALGWKKIVGSLLAERASIRKLEKRNLFIAVNNNVWMQELILRKYQIISEIKFRLHIELRDIIFFLNNEH